jgi:uncharacterized RDD family membrane protein YckC
VYAYGDVSAGRPFRLPGDRNVSTAGFVAAAVACGLGHLLAGWLVLRGTAAGFDATVGRAGRRRVAGAFDTDDAVTPDFAPGGAPSSGADGSADTAAPTAHAGGSTALYAGLGRRAAATAIDVLLVLIVCSLAGLVWGVVSLVGMSPDEVDVPDEHVRAIFLDRLLKATVNGGLLLGWLYHAGCEASRRRATLGKAMLGLFVTDAAGRRVSFARATGRFAVKLLVVGWPAAAADPQRRALHDRVAGTRVYRR